VTIPVATTRISVLRSPDRSGVDPDDYTPEDFTVLSSGIRAVISVSGAYSGSGPGTGDHESVQATLICDPTDLQYLDQVVDDVTGDRYTVDWCFNSPGIAGYLALTKAGLNFRK
jgi:hypothetical protein